uniref:NADH-ubiquinone oxidoreductase chain 4 n=1 Tax=Polytoxus fuscovittatus TaxID=1347745 RepID=A0A7I6HH47_9HEMI|nr:NADH dehydrogenase subunit 4 [Polytoxus fuscovittatus]
MMLVIYGLFMLIPIFMMFGLWISLFYYLWLLFFFLILFYFVIFHLLLDIQWVLICFLLMMIFLSFWIIYLMLVNVNKYLYFEDLYFMLLLLLFCLFMTFISLNLFYFYVFFEFSLIPVFLIIFGWGYQPERLSSGFYLIFYTLFVSLPVLIVIFFIFHDYGCLFMEVMNCNNFYFYVFFVMFFMVKMPMFMIHFWLPKAHVEAPIFGSMILAGVLLKLGGYGLFRVIKFMFFFEFSYFIYSLSLIGIIYMAVSCLYQSDMKSMIAYSSIVHMGLVICGIMSYNYFSWFGCLILMLGHGYCSSMLFYLAYLVYCRSFSRNFMINKGLINFSPLLSLMWFLASVNNMGSPFCLNFFGELFLINGLISFFKFSFLYLFFGLFISCCYSIYLYSSINHGVFYKGFNYFFRLSLIEFYIILMHMIPLNFLFLNLLVFYWV